MRSYEILLDANETQLDDVVIAGTIADIEHYLDGEGEEGWLDSYHEAGEYIGALYEEFAPDIPEDAKRVGILMGATGLAHAVLKYGKDEHELRTYSGSVERNVLAAYHHGDHPRHFVRDMFRFAAAVNEQRPGTYTAEHFARFPGIGAFHDLVMGNGRGNDERQSAELAMELLTRLGFTLLPDGATRAGILATTWDETRCRQAVDPANEYIKYQRASAVADLLHLFDRRGPYYSICLAVENFTKQMHDQIFTREADRVGFRYEGVSIDECFAFIDQSPVLSEEFATFLYSQTGFLENFTPGDPELDLLFPGRQDNIDFTRGIAKQYASGTMNSLDVLHAARDYMEEAGY